MGCGSLALVANDLGSPYPTCRSTVSSLPAQPSAPYRASLAPSVPACNFFALLATQTGKNKKCVEEPDELLKTNHLISDKMPDPDEFMKNKALIRRRRHFRDISRYHTQNQ